MTGGIRHLFAALLLIIVVRGSQAAEFPAYSDHTVYDESFPIYAVEGMSNKLYAVQYYVASSKLWEMRLLSFSYMPGGYLLRNGHVCLTQGYNASDYDMCNAAMTLYDGKLYIRIKDPDGIRLFALDSSGNLTPVKVPENEGANQFAMTVYRNSLCILEIDLKGTLRMHHTSDDPASADARWTHETVLKGLHQARYSYNNYPRNAASDFDATTWKGIFMGRETEQLLVGQYFYATGTMEVHTFDGEFSDIGIDSSGHNAHWSKTQSLFSASPDPSNFFGLKMVTGTVESLKDNEHGKNTVLFIGAYKANYVTGNVDQRQIGVFTYAPENRMFWWNDNGQTYNFATDLPYGKFGACNWIYPVDDQGKARNLICIIRGAVDKHFNRNYHYAIIDGGNAGVDSRGDCGDALTASIAATRSGIPFSIISESAGLTVNCDSDCTIEINDLYGRKIAERICVSGSTHFELPPGIVIVKAGNNAVKALIRQ